ncbi:MAG TPA: hypothetical protein VGE08_00445 [Steroidobacter sp.]|uniref:hypothetical protein n=1 Tax=Steroidobacter sp. TaxID=1978227 RepID=UPI002EDB6481
MLKLRSLFAIAACVLGVHAIGRAQEEGAAERSFEIRFMDFCIAGAAPEMKITLQSAQIVCRCLYDYADERTSPSVKEAIVALPKNATVRDFDDVYASSAMPREVVDAITQEYLRCAKTHGKRTDDR